MKTLARLVVSVVVVAAGLVTSAVTATPSGATGSVVVLAYEGFDYPLNAALTGLDGGTGWSEAWAYPQGGDSPLAVGAALTYPDLPAVGGSATYRGVRAINCSARDLPRSDACHGCSGEERGTHRYSLGQDRSVRYM